MTSVVTIGETMGLFRARAAGPLATGADFALSIGGAESNVAIGLARLGVSSRWIGRVGDDPVGHLIIRELRAENVEALAIVDKGATTGVMVRERRIPGMSRVHYYRSSSAGSRLERRDISREAIVDSAVLHITGITPALSTTAMHAIFGAVAIARAAGVAVSFDVNHRSKLWTAANAAPVYRRLAAQADVVFAGADEAAIFVSGQDPQGLSRELAKLGASQVVIKLGAEGCFALINGVEYEESSHPVTPLDTVGAGDAFVAGYLAELASGKSARTRLKTAVATGALACLNDGDWEGYPTRDELSLLDAIDAVER